MLNAAEAKASAAFPCYAYNINGVSRSPLPTKHYKYDFLISAWFRPLYRQSETAKAVKTVFAVSEYEHYFFV